MSTYHASLLRARRRARGLLDSAFCRPALTQFYEFWNFATVTHLCPQIHSRGERHGRDGDEEYFVHVRPYELCLELTESSSTSVTTHSCRSRSSSPTWGTTPPPSPHSTSCYARDSASPPCETPQATASSSPPSCSRTGPSATRACSRCARSTKRDALTSWQLGVFYANLRGFEHKVRRDFIPTYTLAAPTLSLSPYMTPCATHVANAPQTSGHLALALDVARVLRVHPVRPSSPSRS